MFQIRVDDHITLALLEQRHAPELFQMIDESRDTLRQWLPWVDATATVEDSVIHIQQTLQQFANNQGYQLGICYEGHIVGRVGMHGINRQNLSTSIGYWLSPKYEGKGIMTKACAALLALCFTALDLERVEIRAAVDNSKSRAIPKRLGFVEEGCIRQGEYLYDKYVDLVVYGQLKKEWQALQKS